MINDIITGDAFKSIADDFLDESKPYIDLSKKPKIIFLYTDWIELFKKKVLPYIDYSFKLITHNADRSAPAGNLDLLNDSRLIKWFAMNCDMIHPKLQPIPIGIANEKWPHGDKKIIQQIMLEDIQKSIFCYCNYDISTNIAKRQSVFNIVKSKKFIDIESKKLNFADYLKKLKSSKYVISPPGNSVDCHRIWESIYLGVIPIVEKSSTLSFWEDSPILFVDCFTEITEEKLKSSYSDIINKSNKKALLKYYKQLIL